MTTIIRKNLIKASVVFTADDGSTTQPSAASISINYPGPLGNRITFQDIMSYNSITGAWEYEWDTSAVSHGTIEWAAWGYGTLQAATEGTFDIAANKANIY